MYAPGVAPAFGSGSCPAFGVWGTNFTCISRSRVRKKTTRLMQGREEGERCRARQPLSQELHCGFHGTEIFEANTLGLERSMINPDRYYLRNPDLVVVGTSAHYLFIHVDGSVGELPTPHPAQWSHVMQLLMVPTRGAASWTQIFIYGESRRIMQYIVVRSPRC